LFEKRKLSSPEYKDVDEQFRIANIKLFTTKVAADDLKKYGNALDKV
jgi:DNA repair protein RAD50